MSVKHFLDEYIKGYLLSDLQVMSETENTLAPAIDGHLGYPIFMTCAAGIELLGVLLTERDDDFSESGRVGFVHYWRTYLYKEASRANAAEGVYQLVRNGIAHNFAAKYPHISTQTPGVHLRIKDGVPYIDATTLADDFRWSYDRFNADLRENITVLEDTYERFVRYNEKKVHAHRAALDHLPKVASDMVVVTSHTGSVHGGGATSKGSA